MLFKDKFKDFLEKTPEYGHPDYIYENIDKYYIVNPKKKFFFGDGIKDILFEKNQKDYGMKINYKIHINSLNEPMIRYNSEDMKKCFNPKTFRGFIHYKSVQIFKKNDEILILKPEYVNSPRYIM